MKQNRFFQLLKAETNGYVLVWFAYGLFISVLNITVRLQPQMFGLTSAPTESFNPVIVFMTFWAVFRSVGSSWGTKEASKTKPFETLEFFFTRAISRRVLFYAKASLFLYVCLMPLVAVWAYSYTKPEIKVEFYSNSAGEKATKQFYLTHFSGAHLEKDLDDKEGNKFYVVLPTGRIDQAFFSFVLGCTAVMAYQLASFLLWSKGWGQWVLIFGWIFIPHLGLRFFHFQNSIKTPSGYETNLAWVSQHPALVLLAVGILFVITQTYSCQRFVKTEIL